MIQMGTYLNVVDNSGAKKVMCLKLNRGGYKQCFAYPGSVILVSIKKIKFSSNLKVKKGEIHKALIIRTKNKIKNLSYNYKKYFENSVILLNKNNKLLGTRVFGLIPKFFKYSKFLKIITVSAGVSL